MLGAFGAPVRHARRLLGMSGREEDMSELGLDFELAEMADTIRDETRRLARDPSGPRAISGGPAREVWR